jgi:hypothetical protein
LDPRNEKRQNKPTVNGVSLLRQRCLERNPRRKTKPIKPTGAVLPRWRVGSESRKVRETRLIGTEAIWWVVAFGSAPPTTSACLFSKMASAGPLSESLRPLVFAFFVFLVLFMVEIPCPSERLSRGDFPLHNGKPRGTAESHRVQFHEE